MSVTRNGKMMEMKKYCFVSVLLLGLSFGASAHYTPKCLATMVETEEDCHDANTDSDFHLWVLANRPPLHWHYGNGEAGGWDPCAAAAYENDKHVYNLIDGNCG